MKLIIWFYDSGVMEGCPSVLSVPVLYPYLRAEQLLITVDTHTGMFRCHVPNYEPPIITELESALNADQSRITTLISELRLEMLFQIKVQYF